MAHILYVEDNEDNAFMLELWLKRNKYTVTIAETGEDEGIRLQNELLEVSKKTGIRIIGPNCMGVFDSYTGVDTLFL